MRLTWLSNCPWTPFGYGVQTALITPRLVQAGIPVAVISTYGHQGNAIKWNGVDVFGPSFHPYGMDIMHGHSKTFHADALITLLDVQVMEPDMLQGTPWIPWFPVDHITIPPVILEKLRQSTMMIAMSKHASGELDKLDVPHAYIPCAVDTKIYKPVDKAAARAAMQFPADRFVVGMVAANKGTPSRKAFQANIAAFAALKKMHPDCLLYLHTLDGLRAGWDTENLFAYCETLGLRVGYHLAPNDPNVDVIFADQYGLALGYATDLMATLYNAMDVHLLVTMGEGFGIPLIEAQACGVPVITGSWTSMRELCFSGWKVDVKDTERLFTPLGSFQCLPHVAAITARLLDAYKMRDNPDYMERARKGAMEFDADRITEKYWLPFLKDAEARLEDLPIASRLNANMGILRKISELQP